MANKENRIVFLYHWLIRHHFSTSSWYNNSKMTPTNVVEAEGIIDTVLKMITKNWVQFLDKTVSISLHSGKAWTLLFSPQSYGYILEQIGLFSFGTTASLRERTVEFKSAVIRWKTGWRSFESNAPGLFSRKLQEDEL